LSEIEFPGQPFGFRSYQRANNRTSVAAVTPNFCISDDGRGEILVVFPSKVE
jgi:hypothetical protein